MDEKLYLTDLNCYARADENEVNKYVNQTMTSIVMLIVLTSASILILYLAQRGHYRQMSDAIFYDPVTGGMNNAAFQKRCRQVLDGASPGEYSIGQKAMPLS